ncbi:cytochrome c assembly protein (thioredoxin), putative [Heliomicrobium modesticaldum Ice1]|uniref:Cytochrome c assembly protein (Thioredoxin), putative n=1 Tax=Heliobacterium modesticaldum (strain ATCC 51547 / Ice1) TaxID=498761 RepID=B0TF03_HELMI|nr:TlpA disulfide reductase family protein [Heliomicrobium modesticaldum]ABZ82986.1 cytochrome c assembly protein (thioredoxin), putative [Heliomicrobium modesticaldum Ice1]
MTKTMTKWSRWCFVPLLALSLTTAGCVSSNTGAGALEQPPRSTNTSNEAAKERLKAPDFKLMSLYGKEESLSAYQGKPVVVNFWASWCAPCRNEMPDLNEFAKEYEGKVVVLGVNLTFNDKEKDVRNLVQKLDIKFPILLDNDPNNSAAEAYRIQPIPATFFIDKNGNIADVLIGAARSKNDFIKRVEPLLE